MNRAEQRLAHRWYPKGAMVLQHPDGLGVCYVAPYSKPGTWQVVAYAGNAGKPSFNNWFRTQEQAEKNVETFFTNLLARKVAVLQRRIEQPHSLKVNDIITNSWGYDQTNVDWYRVVKATDFRVWLQPICAHVEETSFMAGPSIPAVDTTNPDPTQWKFSDAKGEVEVHKAIGAGNGESYVHFRHGSGSKWDGRPMYCSWYA